MGIEGKIPLAVIQDHGAPVAPQPAGVDHLAGGHGENGRLGLGGDLDPLLLDARSVAGMDMGTEPGHDPPPRGPGQPPAQRSQTLARERLGASTGLFDQPLDLGLRCLQLPGLLLVAGDLTAQPLARLLLGAFPSGDLIQFRLTFGTQARDLLLPLSDPRDIGSHRLTLFGHGQHPLAKLLHRPPPVVGASEDLPECS